MYKPAYNRNTFPFWTELQIRYRDLDTLNHVNNALFSTYFEEARIRFIQHIPEFLNSMKKSNSFVLVNLEINFVEPVTYPSTLLAGSGVSEFGNSSVTGFQAIYDLESKSLKAVAKSTGVWYNTIEKRPVRLPELPEKENYLVQISS